MQLAKAIVRGALGLAARVYFRRIEVVGAPSREVRGRLFAANHVNGVVDPVVIATVTACDLSPVAKSTLWRTPGLSLLLDVADAVPVVRKRDDPSAGREANDDAFARVGAHLAGGGNLLIFPEGTSHSEPHVLALKTGAGRMLARAIDAGGRDLTFQAVGLEWEDRGTFRSRALVWFGPVRRVDELGAACDELPAEITRVLSRDLSSLVVEGATWPERVLVGRVAELLANDAADAAGTLAEWSALGRRVGAAGRALDDGEARAHVESSVGAYYELLAQAGLSDDRVVSGARPAGAPRRAWLWATLPLALCAAVLYYPPYQLPRLSERLAGSERDVVSTYKIALGLLVFPAWAALLVVACELLLPRPLAHAAAIVALACPVAALPWLDRLDRTRRATRRRLGAAGPPPSPRALREAREAAIAAIERAREALLERGVTP
ncbi:MAG: 1-acyl-sn-glycerol-3-phosphate acyltransferase [Polyangiaceae bacterium]|nr:1-acyl-sn-glycerol-3-phosphate acyltransferase [Polyangiaceae bacterium]